MTAVTSAWPWYWFFTFSQAKNATGYCRYPVSVAGRTRAVLVASQNHTVPFSFQ